MENEDTISLKEIKKYEWKYSKLGLTKEELVSQLYIWMEKKKKRPRYCEICNTVTPFEVVVCGPEFNGVDSNLKWACRKCIGEGFLKLPFESLRKKKKQQVKI